MWYQVGRYDRREETVLYLYRYLGSVLGQGCLPILAFFQNKLGAVSFSAPHDQTL